MNRLAVSKRLEHIDACRYGQCRKIHLLGRRFLLSPAAVTCFAALTAGDSCLIASPLMSSAFHMSSTPTFSRYLFLLLGVHGGKPSEPSGHTDTSLHPWTAISELFTKALLPQHILL